MNKIEQIQAIFEQFMMPPTAIDQYVSTGKSVLTEKISKFVNALKPIKFVMLGFPFKSTNLRDKVLSPYPDLAESKTLENFADFDKLVREVYAPGVEITIVSDGFVFNDLLNLHDAVVHEYNEISADMGRIVTAPMQWYDLNSFYDSKLYLPTKREKLISQFGITEIDLQHKIMFEPDVNFLYRGMIRFMEEELADKEYPSNNQRSKAAKALVRQMMLRNEAYSNLVRHVFKDYIRLSMHKSVNSGEKYSFQLIRSPYAVHSAWHCALVIDGADIKTMHKKDAIEQGYELVYEGTQPYYFTK